MPADVLRELLDRGVAPLRLLAQRHQHDVVEIPCEVSPQSVRRSFTGRRGAGAGDCSTRPFRLFLAYRPFQLIGAGYARSIGGLSAQQPVEQHTERIDIARCGERFTAHLLGARVFRREPPEDGTGRLAPPGLGREELRYAEVEQPRHPLGGDQHIGRLDVAMNDEVLMSVVNRGANALEQP